MRGLCIVLIISFNTSTQATDACAHRGDVAAAPENTIPAFVSAVKKGAGMIEFDVQLSKDGHLVIMHDTSVDRTTNGKGRVSDLTFQELRALDAGGWFDPSFTNTQIPTLEEALNSIPTTIQNEIGSPVMGKRYSWGTPTTHFTSTPRVAAQSSTLALWDNRGTEILWLPGPSWTQTGQASVSCGRPMTSRAPSPSCGL